MRKCPLSHHQGHCILLQLLWRPILESPKVLKTSIFLNQAALFLGIQAKEIYKWKDEWIKEKDIPKLQKKKNLSDSQLGAP